LIDVVAHSDDVDADDDDGDDDDDNEDTQTQTAEAEQNTEEKYDTNSRRADRRNEAMCDMTPLPISMRQSDVTLC
jgi:hypothetical protein